MSDESEFKIWVDADACPKEVKNIIYKISAREKISSILVANSHLNIPLSPFLKFIQVDKGADVADSYIVENLDAKDLVITADIPLAALVVEKGATGINPRGEVYTEENVSERLSIRDFMQSLRDSGVDTGGPASFGPKDKMNFENQIHRIITKLKK